MYVFILQHTPILNDALRKPETISQKNHFWKHIFLIFSGGDRAGSRGSTPSPGDVNLRALHRGRPVRAEDLLPRAGTKPEISAGGALSDGNLGRPITCWACWAMFSFFWLLFSAVLATIFASLFMLH